MSKRIFVNMEVVINDKSQSILITKDVSGVRPLYETFIINCDVEIMGNSVKVKGDEVQYTFAALSDDLQCLQDKASIKKYLQTYQNKLTPIKSFCGKTKYYKPSPSSWLKHKETKDFNKEFINYKITIE